MLYINNLCKNYGSFAAVRNLTLHVPKGDLFGFIGPNGAGKTTTIRIVCGLLRPTSGSVVISGTEDINAMKRCFGYVPDFFGVYDNLKVIEYMQFYGSLYGMTYRDVQAVAGDLLSLVNLEDKRENYVDELSRGMKQRLCVARALLHNPELLMMDEPSSGLDPASRVEMKELLMNLQSMDKTIVISSHILADISEMCNAIGVMNHGTLVAAGKMEDILQRGSDMSELVLSIVSDVDAAVMMLRENPAVSVVSVRQNEIILRGVRDDVTAGRIVADLINRGVVISGFHRNEKSLETIFMNMVGGAQQ